MESSAFTREFGRAFIRANKLMIMSVFGSIETQEGVRRLLDGDMSPEERDEFLRALDAMPL